MKPEQTSPTCQPGLTYAELIERFTVWAAAAPEVRAALIIGSRARLDHPADAWSDLDILLFTTEPGKLIQSSDWAAAFAPCWLTFIELAGDGKSWERRSLYEGGLDVDVAINPAEWLDGIIQEMPPEVADIIRRGVKVLVDKDGKLAQILSRRMPETTLFRRPSEAEFVNQVSDFWYHTLWSIKHLRRGELWWAKSGVDMRLKGLLSNMLEWHAHACKGENLDTWLRGRFLEEWADPRAVEELRGAFAHYDAGDISRALRATMDLYRWLEDETAGRWGYPRPLTGEQQTAQIALQMSESIG
jgi:aminoglycoside 6-adenylyltransferase